MKTILYFVRHGKTPWNEKGKIQGWTDVPLSSYGQSQAKHLVPRFRKTKLDAIYSSTLSRAFHTAKPVADDKLKTIVKVDDLKEANFGVFEGLTWQEIKEHNLIKTRKSYDRYTDTTGGGESIQDVYKRASKSLETIIANHRGETILIVSHGLVMKTLALHMGFVDKKNIEQLRIQNARPYVVEYSHTINTYTPIDFPLHFFSE